MSGDLTNGDDGSTFHTISTLAISPIDPNILLAGSDDGNVHISVNGGLIWNDISAGLPDRWITRVAADPFDANTIYATCSGFRWDEPLPHVYRSGDLGQNWESISANLPELPVNAFIADPTDEGRYFVGTDAGVFVSYDFGLNWESLNLGLGNVPVMAMKIHDAERVLVIGTYGLSAYRLDLSELSVDVPQALRPVTSLVLNGVYPQPFLSQTAGNVWVEVSSGADALAVVRLYDIHGREQSDPIEIRLIAGLNKVQLNHFVQHRGGLKAGTYIVGIQSGGRQVSEKMMVL
jgi:hypothetical protein